MSDQSERRHFRRYPIQLPLLHTPKGPAPAQPGVGWTQNVSEGGACVELAEPLQSRLPLLVHLRTERGIIEAEAEVAWAEKPPLETGGILHGVAFSQFASDPLQTLRELILSKGMVRPAGVRLPFEVPVTYQPRGEAGPPLHGWTHDISRGGLLLRLRKVLPPGTLLEVTLHTHTGPLSVEGAVTWVAPLEGRTPGGPIRHGVRFTALDWSTALSLGLLLTESV
jgi:hypothetical protein